MFGGRIEGADGSSPRAWGKLKHVEADRVFKRTIPTRVGKTPFSGSVAIGYTDHPHARGENLSKRVFVNVVAGPSPRAWGKRRSDDAGVRADRTIPTRVGKT